MTSLFLFISVTPGTVGIRESLFLFFQNLMALTTADVLNIVLTDRGLMFITLILINLSTKVFKYDSS